MPPTQAAPAGLSADAAAIWRAGSEAVGGLAFDFAAEAAAVAWRDDGLEVTMPAAAAAATSFLRRPEVVAGISRALSEAAGRPIRYAIVVTAAAAAADAERERTSPARPAMTQVALLKEVSEHPLVAHARSLFDAAIRKVEPPRPRDMPVPAAARPAGDAVGEGTDAVADTTVDEVVEEAAS